MANFDNLLASFLLIGLFIFSLVAFTVSIQNDNDASDPLTNNQVINRTYANLSNDLGAFRDTSESQREAFEKENPTAGVGSLILFSITSAGKIFGGMALSVYNAVIGLPASILGVDPVVISVISGLLVAAIIFGLWAKYKFGGGG